MFIMKSDFMSDFVVRSYGKMVCQQAAERLLSNEERRTPKDN